MKIVIACIMALGLLACRPEVKTTLLNEETVVTVDLVPTSFNESIKFKLTTDQHVFIGYGMPPPVRIGSKVNFYEGTDDCYYIGLTSSKALYYVGNKNGLN
jgi:hypothetical protein